jgi:hypothetical protein
MSLRNWKLICAAMLVLVAGSAFATPHPDGTIIMERVFNDCPGSTVTTTNMFPFEIMVQDVGMNCYGWANLHLWRMSVGGVEALFPNHSAFKICGNLTISGSGQAEAGLQIAPWWSETDGRFNVRSTDGEVACFGGRLPFYSFTASQGLHYVKGNTINLCMVYLPNGLDGSSPATVTYSVFYDNATYTSGALPFDEGNPADDPPHGLWGMLNDGRVGGHVQPLWALGGDPGATVRATWTDLCFENLDSVPIEAATWGNVKNMYR